MTILTLTPGSRVDATFPALMITDTTTKDTSDTVTQFINSDTTNITIVVNLTT